MNFKVLALSLITFSFSLYSMNNDKQDSKTICSVNDTSLCEKYDIQKIILDYIDDEWEMVNKFYVVGNICFEAFTYLLKNQYLALGDNWGDVRLWDLKSNTLKILNIEGRRNYRCTVNRLIYLPDNEINKLNLDVITDQDLQQIIREYLKNEQLFYASDSNTIKLIDINNLEKISCNFQYEEKIWSRNFNISPDGHYLAYGCLKDLKIFDLKTKTLYKKLNDYLDNIAEDSHIKWGITKLSFSPCSKYITSGTDLGTVKIWDIDTEKCISKFQVKGRIEALSWLSNENLIAIGTAFQQSIWNIKDLSEPKCIKEISYECTPFIKIINIQNTHSLASIQINNNIIKIWDASDSNNIKIFELQNPYNIEAIAASSDGQYLAIGSRNGNVTIWQNKSQYLLLLLKSKLNSKKSE